MHKIYAIYENLADERGKEVVFISHCLLNMNTRYPGGAFRRGCVYEIITQLLEDKVGVIQMKCPEQQVWGGVQKKILWMAFDTEGTLLCRLRPLLLWIFIRYTRLAYRRIANETVKTISDYLSSGIKIRGIIGVDGSPSCGVTIKLDLGKCFDYFTKQHLSELSRKDFNTGLYDLCAKAGSGLYMDALIKELKKQKLDVPFYCHNLMSEMRNQKTELSL